MDLFTILILLLFFLWPVLEAMGQKRKERERIEEMRREEEAAEAAGGGGEWGPPASTPGGRPEEERSFLDEIEERARSMERQPDVWTPAPRQPRQTVPDRPTPRPAQRPAPRPEPSLESFAAPDEREIARHRQKLAAPRPSLQVEAVGGEPRRGGRLQIAPQLRSADRVAEAIVLGEVLGPPRALRPLEEER